MKKREKRSEPVGNVWIATMCEVLKGAVLAGVLSVAGLFLCAVLMSCGVLKENWTEGIVLACCTASTLAGGVYTGRRVSGYRLLTGLGVGSVLFLLLLAAGVLAYGTQEIGQGGTGVLCACLCGGAIAGILTKKPKRKKKH